MTFSGTETALSLLIRGFPPLAVCRFENGRSAGEVGTGETVRVPTVAMVLSSDGLDYDSRMVADPAVSARDQGARSQTNLG